LASQAATNASQAATFATANSRALSLISMPRRAARSRTAPCRPPTPVSEKNNAVRVCSSVRVLSVSLPSAFTSLNSFAYLAESRAGGGPGRNWSDASITIGVIWPSHGVENGFGGSVRGSAVGRQTPGSGGMVNSTGAYRPSPARRSTMRCAAFAPYATPASSAQPSGMPSSEAVYAASSRVCAAGIDEKYSDSRWYAALAAAASGDAQRGPCFRHLYKRYSPVMPFTALCIAAWVKPK
jgi:hypothetical protein